MTAKHTPGPWRVGDAGCTVFGPPREGKAPVIVAKTSSKPIASDGQKDNARLIAAAPELVEVVRQMIDHPDSVIPAQTHFEARALLARIDGSEK